MNNFNLISASVFISRFGLLILTADSTTSCSLENFDGFIGSSQYHDRKKCVQSASVDYLIASANIVIEENVCNPWIVMASVFQLIRNKVGNFRFSLRKKMANFYHF